MTGCWGVTAVLAEAVIPQGVTAVPAQPPEATVERGQTLARVEAVARAVPQEGWMLVPTGPTAGPACPAMTARSTQATEAVQRPRTVVTDRQGKTLQETEATAAAIQRARTAVRAK